MKVLETKLKMDWDEITLEQERLGLVGALKALVQQLIVQLDRQRTLDHGNDGKLFADINEMKDEMAALNGTDDYIL